MQHYVKPTLLFNVSINESPFVTQYFLNSQEMASFNNHDFCGLSFPINDSNEMQLCLNGTKDVSSELEGLTVTLDFGPNHFTRTIVSCDVQNSAACSGTFYVCTLSGPQLEHIICVTSLSDDEGHSVSCSSDSCTPGPI